MKQDIKVIQMYKTWRVVGWMLAIGFAGSPELLAQESNPIEAVVEQSDVAQEKPHERLRKLFDAAISEGDSDKATALFDSTMFEDLIFQDTNPDPKIRTGFMEGFENGGGIGRLFAGIFKQLEGGGTYRWVRNISDENGVRLLYRLVPAEGGINYHEWRVGLKANEPVLIDCFIYLSGEYFSVSLRNLVMPIIASQRQGTRERLQTIDNTMRIADAMRSANDLKAKGDIIGALKAMESTPEVHKSRMIAIACLALAQQISDEEALRIAGQIAKDFPNEPSLRLCTLDWLISQKMNYEALMCLEELSLALEDPYLNVLMVGILCDLDRMDDASKAMNTAWESCSDMVQVHWGRISLSMRQKKFDLTAKYLDQIKQDFKLELFDLRTVPEYEGFTESKEGKEWMAKNQEQK